ncbi:hypothetical protein SAMN02745127_00454 [Oceanospirillum multiglobuliferum]|uniref:hypothetical protein n=1 Tax=Oceanospirillum multiglobuliferum TaxID=64969 RepID=UPI0009D1210A|nr:hypothetical protein [Oceanospirillum multiglobuliferum]SJZ53524.1 hypothetical protein SAMN02745127_00454 [Oceanospirillum multiglobuliferum]
MAVELMISVLLTTVVAAAMWVGFQQMKPQQQAIRIKAQYRKKDRWDNPDPR